MSTLVAEIAGKIQLLTSAEKNDLLRLLLLDIDGAVDPDADEAWRNEIVHRVKAIRNGEAAIRALQAEWQE
ncbi:MAG TPA: addiction module protein [Telluria sp.]|nr:addiction module protein [Telluria sp.]